MLKKLSKLCNNVWFIILYTIFWECIIMLPVIYYKNKEFKKQNNLI